MDYFGHSSTGTNSMEICHAVVQHLDETRKWKLFISIMGMVFIGLLHFALGIFALLSPMDLFPAQDLTIPLALLMARLIYYFPKSELLHLKPGDIYSNRHLLFIRNPKGNRTGFCIFPKMASRFIF